jgi:hypothetical protein
MLGKYTRADIEKQFKTDVFENSETVESFAARKVDNFGAIDVNWENMSFYNEEALHDEHFGAGWHEVDGVPIYVGYVNGDWEWPVSIIFYLNENGELRAYYPIDGNIFNMDTKTAIGNNEEADLYFLNNGIPAWMPNRHYTEDDFNNGLEPAEVSVTRLIEDFKAHVNS